MAPRTNVNFDRSTIRCTVMRKEAVYAVILNVPLFKGMVCFIAADPRFLRFSVIEDGKTTHYNLRVRFFPSLLSFRHYPFSVIPMSYFSPSGLTFLAWTK